MAEEKNSSGTAKRLFLIDGSSYIYRAFFALPHLSNSRGLPTNAAYGFTSMLNKVIREKSPDFIAVVFDAKGPTFRHEMYEHYKANRSAMPDNLIPQIPYIHKIVTACNIPLLLQEGVEADDIIGTMSNRAAALGLDVVIVTGDKDMMQLVTPTVTLLDTMKDRSTAPREVMEKFGVEPERVVDVMGLMGDSSDNIPGIPGVGEKTAVKLMAEYGSMDNIYNNIDRLKGKLKEKLERNRDLAYLSRELATINRSLDIDLDLEKLKLAQPDLPKLRELFRELEFPRFLRELTPQKTLSMENYSLLLTLKEIQDVTEMIGKSTLLSIDLETTSIDPIDAAIVGISFSFEPHKAYYIPVGHSYDGAPQQPLLDDVLKHLRPILESGLIKKTGHNLKYDYMVFKSHGVELDGIYCDTMVASYLLNPSRHSHSLEEVAREYLDHQMITFKDVVKDPKKVTFDMVDIKTALEYSGEDADAALLLSEILLKKLDQDGFSMLFHEVEMPLIEVLADIELAGVKVDTGFLGAMSLELQESMDSIIGRIYEVAGEEFNINSPKQLSVILFKKLGLPAIKKTKTGFSTNNEVLVKLADRHELPAEILQYRSVAKLKSTYIDSLPGMVNSRTGRVHTSFNQAVTSTGRLSSSNPNLQNIPVKTELGKRIREAFVPDEGAIIMSSDYSQVELRIMAHLSGDRVLLDSFAKGEDIHQRTAAEVFGIFPQMVTPEMRREAKVINFGIIYGMGAFSLSKELNITPKIARAYIDGYFQKYQGVRDFLDATIASAREKGYVSTIMNRRCYVQDINSVNANQRQFAERIAINAPIQGSAADIIKVAMVRIHRRLKEEQLKSKIIIQVHDELVFEVPMGEIAIIKKLVTEEMEGVVDLAAPLKVDIGTGKNWAEAH